MSRTNPILVALALAVVASQARANDVDPEPPGGAKSLEKIARTMGEIVKRLKDASVGDETQKLQVRVLAQLDEALRREKVRKAPKDVAASLDRVRAMQERIAASVKRAAEKDAMLAELSEYQAKAAQMLRDAAAQRKPAR